MSYFDTVTERWGDYWSARERKKEFVFSLSGLTAIMFAQLHFLHYNESRPGILLPDPVLALITPIDLSNLIFVLLYLGLIITVVQLLPHPERFSFGLQVYALFACMRILAMWLVPLNPPQGMIALADPVLSWAQTGKQLNKDLFFSGHTATMYICHLVLPPGRMRRFAIFGFLLMAVCLIMQRVHYTADVVVAPFFCYGSLRIIKLLRWKLGLETQLS